MLALVMLWTDVVVFWVALAGQLHRLRAGTIQATWMVDSDTQPTRQVEGLALPSSCATSATDTSPMAQCQTLDIATGATHMGRSCRLPGDTQTDSCPMLASAGMPCIVKRCGPEALSCIAAGIKQYATAAMAAVAQCNYAMYKAPANILCCTCCVHCFLTSPPPKKAWCRGG